MIQLMTESLREHRATSNDLVTAINKLTTAISTHIDTLQPPLNWRLKDEGNSSKTMPGDNDTCVAGHVRDINSCTTANHAQLRAPTLDIQEQASDIRQVMKDIKCEETVRTLNVTPANLPSCSE